MKEIIIGTDFSKGALNALNYGLLIANKIGANITLVWVDKPSSADSVFDNAAGSYRKEVHRRFEELIKKYSKELKKGTLGYKIRSGKVYAELGNQAKYDDAKLIIVGTHGISGFEEIWIGSNANRVVSSSPCPVITVRQGYVVKKKISKIVMPIDSTMETRQKAPYVAEIAKAFNAEVLIPGLIVSSVSTIKNRVINYCRQMVEYFDKHEIKNSTMQLKVSNITSDTLKFAEQNDADLICIMTEQETAAANIFLGPYAQQMVNHSPIPVLSIHPKNFYRIK
jgi:nucleotide-binding universal stress UspA family protein